MAVLPGQTGANVRQIVTGTASPFTLGAAVANYLTLAAIGGVASDTFYGTCEEVDASGNRNGVWVYGLWTIGSGTVTLTTALRNSAGGTTAPTFGAGTKHLYISDSPDVELTALEVVGGEFQRASDDSPMVWDKDVRGGASNLNQRLSTISNFVSPNAGGVVTGQYYDNSFQGTASSTLIGAANRIELAPYYTSVQLAIDRLGVAVSTGVASATCKCVIYSSDANGWPDVRLYETATLDCSSTGMKEETLSFTFSSGVKYWVGVRHSSTATLRTINVSSAVNLGLTSSSASNYATVLRRTLTYATAATSPWTFVNADRTANITPPSIRFRAA